MINICNFLHVISESTNWSLASIPWEQSSSSTPHFYSDGTLETTYGITAALAELISRITRVSQAIRFYSTKSATPPAGLEASFEHLAAAIASLPTLEGATDMPQDCDEHVQILLHEHLEAFALSTKVYFYNTIRPCSSGQMDRLIDEIGRKLNMIEQKKQAPEMQYARTATIAWPGFVAACEARHGQRELWCRWWTDMTSYGIGNIKTLWAIVQESWALRDAGSTETPAWLPVLRTQQKFILAV